LALYLALLCLDYSNAQVDSTTGNLTNFTGRATDTTSNWNNAGSVGQPLTCWQGGDPGYCGPNPRVSAWGAGSNVINFSYGTVNLNQVVDINKALAVGGSGVQLSGFNFGFTAKNGNGWDNGQQDYLGAFVKFYNNATGLSSVYDYTSQTNKKYNWTTFNFSDTFSSPVPATKFSNVEYGFVGRDNNYWVGPYGPEIINVNFSLKYTVKPDPCISDPLSSPTCPGYALATVKNSILGSTVSNASATSFVPAMNYTQPAPAAAPPAVADAAPALAQASPQQQAQQPAQQSPQPQQQQQGQDPNQNPGGTQGNPTQPSPQQAGPAPTSPQPAGGPPQTATASATQQSSGPQQGGGGPSKLAMSVVKSAQAKEQAVQQMAVQQSAKAFENTQSSSQAASNLAISINQDMSANSATAAAQFSSQTTQASQQTASQQTQQQQTTQTGQQTQQTNKISLPVQQSAQDTQQTQIQTTSNIIQTLPPAYTAQQQPAQDTQSTQTAMLKPPTQPIIEVPQTASSGTGLTVSRNLFAYNPLMSFNSASATPMLMQQLPTYQPKLDTKVEEVEAPQFQTASFGGAGRAGNPLSEIMMQQRFELMQNNIAAPASAVNKNVQPNELARGVDIASMATTPAGFNAYSFVLKDAAFYEPKEVYKNQRTVDNERVLRGLTRGSDSLHQQMVDQQYKLGN